MKYIVMFDGKNIGQKKYKTPIFVNDIIIIKNFHYIVKLRKICSGFPITLYVDKAGIKVLKQIK
jgi:hypothetical protein